MFHTCIMTYLDVYIYVKYTLPKCIYETSEYTRYVQLKTDVCQPYVTCIGHSKPLLHVTNSVS